MGDARSSGRETRSDAARLLLAAARERFAVAATDLLLPDKARLTEWQRLTAAALLARLVRSVNDWAKENRDKLQQNFLMSFPVVAERTTVTIDLLADAPGGGPQSGGAFHTGGSTLWTCWR